jgi:hypothetical protein
MTGEPAPRKTPRARRWDGKPCARCGKRKTPARALAKYCGPCDRAVSREHARQAHARYLLRTYGITIAEYEAIYQAQGGACYICRVARGTARRLSVDHDHKLGSGRTAVRGLLCRKCNDILGFYRDNPDAFTRAISYLASPPAWQVIPRETPTMEGTR